MGFLGGLAGIGKSALGALGGGGSPDLANTPQGGFKGAMGGLSQGLAGLSANLMDQPAPATSMLRRRPMPMPVRPLGVPEASPEGSLSRYPYSGADVSMGGGFAT